MAKKNSNVVMNPFECRRDGLTIRGEMYRPAGSSGKLPVAVVSHAFMMNMDMTRPYAEFLAEAGYLALCYDFCGGSMIFKKNKSDGKTTDMSVKTEAADLKAVIAFAQSQNDADPEKLLLMGCSQGGFVSGIVAQEMGAEKVQDLILFYPAICIPDDARAGKMLMAKFDPANVPEILNCFIIKLGRQYVTDVIDWDANELITHYQGNVCYLQGDKDPIVNISYAEKAVADYKANRTTDKLVYYKVLPGAGHGFKRKYADMCREYLKEFLSSKK